MRSIAGPLILLALLAACLPRPRPSSSSGNEGLPSEPEVQIPSNGLGNQTDLPQGMLSLTRIDPRPGNELVWALSQCRCMPSATAELLKTYAMTEGVLTQFLVPRVRETIRANSQLKLVLSLPGLLKEVLKTLFANDKALATQVRENLSKKIAKVINAELKDSIDFRFDHYLLSGKEGETFAIKDMVARWNLVFSVGNFWKNGKAVAFDNHGLQILESARALSEWKYAFALDKNSKGGYYGGLTFDTKEPQSGTLFRLDPREEPEARRTVSGSYSLKIPDDITALQLVMDVKETWVRSPEAPTIVEQAMMWNAGAEAFSLLRVDRRQKHTEALYGESDDFLLPLEAHRLPLIFMSGVQGQLQDIFLDKELRSVKNSNNPEEIISLRVMSRLGRSLFSWISVLTDLDKAGLEADQLKRLSDAPDKMKDGLRLVLLNILKERKLADMEKESIADLAEGISLIVDVDQNLLPSPHFQKEALEAFRKLVVLRFLPAWKGTSKQKMTSEDLIWFYTAAAAVSKYPIESHQIPWLKNLVATLEKSLGVREEFPWE
jgi:hypothetical protein